MTLLKGAVGGVGIPLIEMLAKSGKSAGGGGIPANTAGSGTTMFSGGKKGVELVPNNGAPDNPSVPAIGGGA